MKTSNAQLANGVRLSLPRPERLVLRNFSLYDNAPVIEAYFGDGVFCLAGANGLGKSTFLAALNYAITGIVADSSRRFESVNEYYRKSQLYSAEYFRGRIDEGDAEAAQVELEMSVGGRRYRIVRGMFDPIGLREFEIHEPQTDEEAARFDAAGVNESARHDVYANAITGDVGLDSFEQLVFLQHFVLTFDERRHLLFWDERVAQAALYIAFGLNVEKADRADTLRRSAERADSLARNLQWQATDLRKRLKDVEEALSRTGRTDDDIVGEHQRLLDDREDVAQRIERLEADYRDATVRVADKRAQLHALTADYEALFRAHMTGRFPAGSHPVVVATIEHEQCAICGAGAEGVVARVREQLEIGACPMCGTDLAHRAELDGDDASVERVAELEGRVSSLESELNESEAAVIRTGATLAEARATAEALVAKLAAFERENEAFLLTTTNIGSAAAGAADHFRTQIAEIMDRKRQQLDRRNAARAELRVLQDELTLAYSEAEEDFVPLFTTLAREFLGIDLEIALQTQSGGVHLLLTVQGTTRRVQDSLSESQRFFVDIALRMALAQQMSRAHHPACLYVDTPEGSLDIAYESRAGSMFGQFVTGGHQMIMTANINTSQLLRKLAATCGPEQMTLMRMTEWTALSEVQSAEEDLFDRAYAEIEAALAGGG